MLKFKKDGKVVGKLQDDANEPEGEAFKFKDEKEADIVPAEPEEETTEEEDETVE